MDKINTSIIKNMCIFSAANCKEAFIYQYSNGKICFGDLKTLNHIANNVATLALAAGGIAAMIKKIKG